MKKLVVSLLIMVIIAFSVFLLYNKVVAKQQLKENYGIMPSFQLTDLQGKLITKDSLKADTSTLFLFFDPECEHCKEEFEQINDYRDFLSDCQMVFVSTLPEKTIAEFLQQIDFQILENMFVLRDKNAELAGKMDIKSIPSVLIYNKDRQLVKRYAGQVKAETLIKYLSE
jgi:protein-disulfide isomerase